MSRNVAVRDRRQTTWYWIEKDFLRFADRIGLAGIAVYNVLASHCDNQTQQTYVSIARIASELGISRRSVERALKKLEEYGLIHRFTRLEKEQWNVYALVNVPRSRNTRTTPLFEGEGASVPATPASQAQKEQGNRSLNSAGCDSEHGTCDRSVAGTASKAAKNVFRSDPDAQPATPMSQVHNAPATLEGSDLRQVRPRNKEDQEKTSRVSPAPAPDAPFPQHRFDRAEATKALCTEVSSIDQPAVDEILAASLAQRADLRNEEFESILQEKVRRAKRTGIDNLVGFLKRELHKCFMGEAFEHKRRQLRQAAAARAAAAEDERRLREEYLVWAEQWFQDHPGRETVTWMEIPTYLRETAEQLQREAERNGGELPAAGVDA